MSTASEPTSPSPKDKKYYPDKAEFLKALQDPGVPDTTKTSGAGEFKFPKLKKICNKIYNLLKKYNVPNLPSNKSRGSESIMSCIKKRRKLVDKTDVFESFASYATKESTSQVYILHNDEEYFGFDLILTLYFNYLSSNANKKETSRSPGDAIRVAAIMLLAKYRGSVAGVLSGVRDRQKCDQPVPTHIALAHEMLTDFKDDAFEVSKPPTMLEDDVVNIDPNNSSRIEIDRDAQWFLDTYFKYIKPKYKAALKQWDTKTGLGSCEPWEFSKFCDDNSRWLVWVYLMDKDNDFLLFSNAKGKPPPTVGSESGFDTPMKRKRDETVELLQETQTASKKVVGILDRLDSIMEKYEDKLVAESTTESSLGLVSVEKNDIINQLLDQQQKRDRLMKLPLDRSLQRNVVSTIDTVIKGLAEQLQAITNKESTSN